MTNDVEHELEQMVLDNWGLVHDLHTRAIALFQRILDDTRTAVEQREEVHALEMEPWFEGKAYWTLHLPGPQGTEWFSYVSMEVQKDTDKPTAVVRTAFNTKTITRNDLKPELEGRLPANLARYRATLGRTSKNVIAEYVLTDTNVDALIDKIVEEALSQLGLAALVVNIVQERQSSSSS